MLVKNTEDASNVWFHFIDCSNAVLFPLSDTVVITFELGVDCVRDTGDLL